MSNLKNKICLLTGGTGNIGKSIIEELLLNQAIVIFTFYKKQSIAKELLKLNNQDKLFYFKLDTSNENSIKNVISKIKRRFKKIDILINNAGINTPNDFEKISRKEWDKILNINLRGPFLVIRESLGLLRKSSSASVINISSISGQIGGPRTTHYAVSKAGLIALTQNAAISLAKYNIRCNTIAPGYIQSNMEKKSKNKTVEKLKKNILMKRLGRSSEVAYVVSFLASNKSEYMTGHTINLNGGLVF
tara:strand:- start:3121 stop:3861 length:741 start_codon:yes stop_codon:yes gene_type:complete